MEKKEVAAQCFADYVNNNYEERMKEMYQIIGLFRPKEGGDELQYKYELGFITALQWIGELLGVELAMPDEEDRAEIDKVFEGL